MMICDVINNVWYTVSTLVPFHLNTSPLTPFLSNSPHASSIIQTAGFRHIVILTAMLFGARTFCSTLLAWPAHLSGRRWSADSNPDPWLGFLSLC